MLYLLSKAYYIDDQRKLKFLLTPICQLDVKGKYNVRIIAQKYLWDLNYGK